MFRHSDPVYGSRRFSDPKERYLVFSGNRAFEPAVLYFLLFSRDQHDGSVDQVLVDGVDVATCDERTLAGIRRRVGYLFQGGALLAWMTVAENVALPLRETTDLPDDEIDRRVAKALESVELSDAADKYPSEISGGMQKRAGLARAVVRESDIVLYDEPTSGLDPVTSITINRLIKKLNRALGITSVVVTHDLASALSFADRILLMKGGRVVECSAPAAFARSENAEVREFLSAMKGEMQ